jgi:hypothetical protein
MFIKWFNNYPNHQNEKIKNELVSGSVGRGCSKCTLKERCTGAAL